MLLGTQEPICIGGESNAMPMSVEAITELSIKMRLLVKKCAIDAQITKLCGRFIFFDRFSECEK